MTAPNAIRITIFPNTSRSITVQVINYSVRLATEGIQGPTGLTGPIGPAGPTGPTGAGVIVGGSAGQVLTKQSSADYDTVWQTPTPVITVHGSLTGLGADDHTQYHNDARGDARYYTKTLSDANFEPKNSNIQAHIANTSNPHSTTKLQVGLGNADDTSDVNKPVSTAQQTALNLKEDLTNKATSLASPDNTKYPTTLAVFNAIGSMVSGVSSFNTRTGAVLPQSGDYTKSDVGLGNVDNTSDVNKPVSTATQTALNAKVDNTQSIINALIFG